MRIHGTLLLVLPLALAGVARSEPSVSTLVQSSQGDLRTLLEERLRTAGRGGLAEIWQAARSLRDAAEDFEGANLAAEIDRLLEARPELEPAPTLLLASLRISAPDVDVGALAARLQTLLQSSGDDDHALGAAGLLADPQFRSLGAEAKRDALALLASLAKDAARAPRVRLEAANAQFQLGGGEDKRAARRLMEDFLGSSDPALRGEGALALARTNAEISGRLYEELRRLSTLPGDKGTLAASYLERERVREFMNRKLKNLQALQGEQAGEGAAFSASADKLEELNRVMLMITNAHLEGDKADKDQLLEAAMDGMLRSLDEHSSYLSPKQYARFEQELEAGYGGIGAYVGEDPGDGLFTITHPIYSGPAYKAGLLSEDKIVRIDDWPTIGKPVDEIIKRLKGRPGTSVTLYVWRRGMEPTKIDRPSEDMQVVVQRASITIPSVNWQLLPGDIGVLTLRDFSRVASAELRKPLLEMIDAGMKGLILDLRDNSGGLLDEAVNVSGLFLPKGSLVVSTESRVRPTEKLSTREKPIVPADMPMVVMVNRFSASAAEIVSGALQDHGRAIVIGKRSFGKGSVQNLLPVVGFKDDEYEDENGNGRHDNWERLKTDYNKNGEFDFAPRVKLTIARYLLPSGRSIHKETEKDGTVLSAGGVQPDVEVDPRRMETWRLEEMFKLRNDQKVRDYIDRMWNGSEQAQGKRELFFELAENDRKDVTRYPGFEEFYLSLDTPLARDDVRQLVRFHLRRRVQDARGREFPSGDFVEDRQLQTGIRVVLEKLGTTPSAISEYQTSISDSGPGHLAHNMGAGSSTQIQQALREVDEARKSGDGRLTEATLARLAEILQGKLDR